LRGERPSPLRQYRLALGYTRAEVARRLGVSVHAVRSWERGERVPKLLEFTKLAALYGLSLERLWALCEATLQQWSPERLENGPSVDF
jgi:transcriptional regulator with XRE-family HTH domain